MNESEAKALAIELARADLTESPEWHKSFRVDENGNVFVEGGNVYEPRKSVKNDYWIVYCNDGESVNCYTVDGSDFKEDEHEGDPKIYPE